MLLPGKSADPLWSRLVVLLNMSTIDLRGGKIGESIILLIIYRFFKR